MKVSECEHPQAMDIGNREKKETKQSIGDLGKVASKITMIIRNNTTKRN